MTQFGGEKFGDKPVQQGVSDAALARYNAVLSKVADIDGQQWDALAMTARPACAVSARPWLSAMMGDEGEVLTVYDDNKRLCGVVGVEWQGRAQGRIMPIMTGLRGNLAYSAMALLDGQNPSQAFGGLLSGAGQLGAYALRLDNIPADTQNLLVLRQTAERNGLALKVYNKHRRAALNVAGQNYDAWFNENFSKKRRKEYNRLYNRLAEHGQLKMSQFSVRDNLDHWCDEFLQLEAAGWKGSAGTALAKKNTLAGTLKTALNNLATMQQLLFWRLSLDGKPVAMMFASISGKQVWLGKIAYDENYGKFSPGVQIMLAATKDLFADERVELVDSCAQPNHPMIDNIWRDRVVIADVLMAAPSISKAKFSAITMEETSRRWLRKVAKTCYLKLKSRR